MFDEFWWWTNRKPSRRVAPYLSMMAVNLVYGVILVLGIAVLGVKVWLGLVIIAYSLAWLGYSFYYDNKNGYVDAYYQAYLAQRDRIGKRLGKL